MAVEHSVATGGKSRTLVGWLVSGLLPSIAVLAFMVGLYVLLPPPQGDESGIGLIGVAIIMLSVYVGLMIWAVRRLRHSRRPIQEGILLLMIMTTLLITSFAWVYLAIAANDAHAFTQSLSKISSIYFTVTVLSTVGFGDITPVTATARMVVTGQMILGVTLLSLGVRILMRSVKTTRSHQASAVATVGSGARSSR